ELTLLDLVRRRDGGALLPRRGTEREPGVKVGDGRPRERGARLVDEIDEQFAAVGQREADRFEHGRVDRSECVQVTWEAEHHERPTAAGAMDAAFEVDRLERGASIRAGHGAAGPGTADLAGAAAEHDRYTCLRPALAVDDLDVERARRNGDHLLRSVTSLE